MAEAFYKVLTTHSKKYYGFDDLEDFMKKINEDIENFKASEHADE